MSKATVSCRSCSRTFKDDRERAAKSRLAEHERAEHGTRCESCGMKYPMLDLSRLVNGGESTIECNSCFADRLLDLVTSNESITFERQDKPRPDRSQPPKTDIPTWYAHA